MSKIVAIVKRNIKGILGMLVFLLGALCYIVALGYSIFPFLLGDMSKAQCIVQCVIGLAIGACLIYFGALIIYDADQQSEAKYLREGAENGQKTQKEKRNS